MGQKGSLFLFPSRFLAELLNVLIYFSFCVTDRVLIVTDCMLKCFSSCLFERRKLVEFQFIQQMFVNHLLCDGHYLRFWESAVKT